MPYEPGTLKAVNSKGKEEFVLKTAGEPAAIRLIADRSKIKACKNDLSYVKIELVDKNGNVVPETSLPVKIECTGKGTVIAGGNAAYADMKSFRSLTPPIHSGERLLPLFSLMEKKRRHTGESLCKRVGRCFHSNNNLLKSDSKISFAKKLA